MDMDTQQVTQAKTIARPFLSTRQFYVLSELAKHGHGKEIFMQQIIQLAQRIEMMPKTYEQDGKGYEAIVYLHYFRGSSNWYITEKDIKGGVKQAFGYAILNGDDQMAELGYISINEIIKYNAELNLHFVPCSVGEIKAQRKANSIE